MSKRKSQSAAINTNKIGIIIGLTYGNYTVLEKVKIPKKVSRGNGIYVNCMATAWKCLHNPTGNITITSTGYLSEFKTLEQETEYLNNLVKENKHQLGFRNYLYYTYKNGAHKRNIDFDLTQDEFEKLISLNCYYCGEKPHFASEELIKSRGNPKLPSFAYNGIDRIDSSKGYNIENCVPCCAMCNYMKNTYSKEDFLNLIFKIYNYLINSSETIENTSIDGSELSTSQAYGDGNKVPLTGNAEGEDIVRPVL